MSNILKLPLKFDRYLSAEGEITRNLLLFLGGLMEQGQVSAIRKTRRILVAEDCPDSQMLLSMVLKKAGMTVTTASNGQECVDLIQQNTQMGFDLVLMDLQMPVLDGIRAVRRLRSEGCDVPIVAMSARVNSKDEGITKEAGCNAYINKLSGKDALLETINVVLRSLDGQKDLDIPVLPSLPGILNDHPEYSGQVLNYIEKLPKLVKSLEDCISRSDWETINEVLAIMGASSLYGYSVFSDCFRQMQRAAEAQCVKTASLVLRQLKRAAASVVAGRSQVEALANKMRDLQI